MTFRQLSLEARQTVLRLRWVDTGYKCPWACVERSANHSSDTVIIACSSALLDR